MRVIPFARTTRNTALDEHGRKGWQLRHTAGAPGHGTDLEAAIRNSVAALPAGMVPRLVLVSDGNENLGSVARGIWQAQQLGVPIDTVAVAGRPKPGLLLETVSFPGQVFSGERFPIEVTLESPSAAQAAVELTAEGKQLGEQVALAAGTNHRRLEASVNSVGAIALGEKISADGLGEARFEDAVILRHPRVLLVSNDPPASEVHLQRTLQANKFEVEHSQTGIPEKLDDFQLIVINNWDIECFRRRKNVGGGISSNRAAVFCGSPASTTFTWRRRRKTPIERTLPAKLAPPRSPEGTCVVLIIDKSSSMEGQEDRAGAAGGDRRGRQPAARRYGGRAHLRQLLPMDDPHSPRRRTGRPSSG